jgi:hypothetical protein
MSEKGPRPAVDRVAAFAHRNPYYWLNGGYRER